MALLLDEIQVRLEAIPGVMEAYFQPPSNVQMVYPCIVYELDDMDTQYADNRPYTVDSRYQVTAMDLNPLSEIPKALSLLPTARFNRFFVVDNLNHFVFSIFF